MTGTLSLLVYLDIYDLYLDIYDLYLDIYDLYLDVYDSRTCSV